MCFPPGRCPKTENPTPHLPRPVFSFCQHSRLLTFHITELGHFCGHFPSKPDGFFHTPRPHAAIIHRIQPGARGKNIASSPSISPSRTNFVIIYPQKKACFSRSSAPMPPLLTQNPNWAGAETLPLTFHITDLDHFYRHLPSKIRLFFGRGAPQPILIGAPPTPGIYTLKKRLVQKT